MLQDQEGNNEPMCSLLACKTGIYAMVYIGVMRLNEHACVKAWHNTQSVLASDYKLLAVSVEISYFVQKRS